MESGSLSGLLESQEDRDDLALHVRAFTRWKQEVVKEITRYRQWLQAQGLSSGDIDSRLNQALRTLKSDRILLAFVGEFSRGKSEIINALLCRHYGQRLLPTRIGRTTMCPTELYYDASVTGAYVKLLPIQTRKDGILLSEYKQQLEHWVHLTINLDDIASMKKAFEEVAKTVLVPEQEARDLGFQVEYLESSLERPGMMHVPAWRHALINMDHPLLRQGLSIIDTPGLNALGSEPELTLSMLPDAHAILFVLSADTGLTATDHMIWKDHIQDIVGRRGAALYGVLNKIDMLWDEDEEDEEINRHIRRLAQMTAKQLEVPSGNILPLSSRSAVKARLRADPVLLARSHLLELEQVLAKSVVSNKQKLLQQTIVQDLLAMIFNSRKILLDRQSKLKMDVLSRQEVVADDTSDHEKVMLMRTVQQEQQIYNRRLTVLHSSRKLVETQVPKFRALAGQEQLQKYLEKARQVAGSGVLGSGLSQAVPQLFADLRTDISKLKDEVGYMEWMVQKLYQRYAQESKESTLDFPRISIMQFAQDLAQLEQQSMPFRSRLGNMMGAQKASDKFFGTIARLAGDVYLQAGVKAEQWCKSALGPLMQQTMQHRTKVQQLMDQLNRMTNQQEQGQEQGQEIGQKISEMDTQLKTLDDIAKNLKAELTSQA